MAGQPPQGQGGYPPPPSGNGPHGQAGQQQPYGQAQQHQGVDPNAPYGYDKLGRPYSDKEKNLVGGLQLLPCVIAIGGIGRLYAGDTGTGIAQLLLSCLGIGQIWSIIDGIIILTSDSAMDTNGRPFRP